MLIVNIAVIVTFTYLVVVFSKYWIQLRDPFSPQSEFCNQRSPAFRKFMILFAPLMLLNLVFQIANSCYNVYALLRQN